MSGEETPAVDAGAGLAGATSESVSMVAGAVFDSIAGTIRIMAPVLLGAAFIAACIATVVVVGRIRAEAAAGKRSLDPRGLVDPAASDVLGET